MKIAKEFPEKVLQLWDGWELRAMVCLSLGLQIILVMLASRRKYIARSWIRFLVWSAYLLADLVATATLGILARNQGFSGSCWEKSNHSIQAFWAPFLLLHLGGPDTITAYSIQDNELWLRHLLGLIIQVAIAFYVFVMSWNGTILTFLSIPMFVSGIIKYGERTLSLKSSTNSDIKNILLDVPPQEDQELVKVFPRQMVEEVKTLLHQAYYLFRMSLFHFEDLILGVSELEDSYSLVSSMSAKEAFEVVEVELGFIYDIFYTKAIITYSNFGIILRLVCFVFSVITSVSFFLFIDKNPYLTIDVDITYLLLSGAIVLEVYAFLCLVFSDWTMVWYIASHEPQSKSFYGAIYNLYYRFTKGKRWCGSIGQFNLIRSCLKIKGRPKFLEEMMKHVYTHWKTPKLEMKAMIFDQLFEKSKMVIEAAEDIKLRGKLVGKLVAQRGDGVLDRMQLSKDGVVQPIQQREDGVLQPMQLAAFRSAVELEFNHSLFVWHIATDICYCADVQNVKDRDAKNLPPNCKISKRLSDYMMYLLVIRPSMLPKGIGHDKETRYRDACDEMREYLDEKGTIPSDEMNVCAALLGMKETAERAAPRARKKKLRTYQLVDGCELAKKLQELKGEQKWKMVSSIWIEMLCYAAIECQWKEHAEGLGRGGELLTHVCVLMTHLGLSQQYQGPSSPSIGNIEVTREASPIEVTREASP